MGTLGAQGPPGPSSGRGEWGMGGEPWLVQQEVPTVQVLPWDGPLGTAGTGLSQPPVFC
jgi:hypothetical protein